MAPISQSVHLGFSRGTHHVSTVPDVKHRGSWEASSVMSPVFDGRASAAASAILANLTKGGEVRREVNVTNHSLSRDSFNLDTQIQGYSTDEENTDGRSDRPRCGDLPRHRVRPSLDPYEPKIPTQRGGRRRRD